ncbi:MAG TPA: NAD(P)-binding protein [Caulobacteraceae bacterium]|nr:NAD(P)-binding protein [Caulobacteraceae bacterium]
MTDGANGRISLGARAVVVGAGVGGMMAAQVLSRHFDDVLVLEKDTLPAAPEARMAFRRARMCMRFCPKAGAISSRCFPASRPN